MATQSLPPSATCQSSPSILDFIAQNSLNALLHPAAKRIVDVIYNKYPECEYIWRHFEETFLVGSSVLQLYFLKRHSATFAESFYGLRRVPVLDDKRLTLSKREIMLSIIAVCLIPYIERKLQARADELHFSEGRISKNMWLINGNKALQVSLQLCQFVQHLRYISGTSPYNSSLLWFAGLQLQYAAPDEMESLSFRNFIPRLMQRSFELSAFFLQFYHWWQTDYSNAFSALPVPPPPKIEEGHGKYSGLCPICWKEREIDTALSVSGFIFCFTCIHDHLNKIQRCPITNIPATISDLIRIVPPSC